MTAISQPKVRTDGFLRKKSEVLECKDTVTYQGWFALQQIMENLTPQQKIGLASQIARSNDEASALVRKWENTVKGRYVFESAWKALNEGTDINVVAIKREIFGEQQ